jgi:hypothetical protein
MQFVFPKDIERYYLRLILLHVSGVTSFKDLRTVNIQVFYSYKETAIALGLVEDDSYHNTCLMEASLIQTGKQLMHLLCIILLYSEVQNPFLPGNITKMHYARI